MRTVACQVPARTVACQVPLSMGFSRQEYWSGLLFPFLGDLSDPGIEPVSPESPAWQTDSSPLSHQGSSPPAKALTITWVSCAQVLLMESLLPSRWWVIQLPDLLAFAVMDHAWVTLKQRLACKAFIGGGGGGHEIHN